MSTEFFNDQWRIPSNENQNKVSNYSMDFSGVSAGIDCGPMADLFGVSSVNYNTSFSIWIKPEFDYTTPFYQTFFGNYTSGLVGVLFYYHMSSDRWVFLVGDGAATSVIQSSVITSNQELGKGEWQHHCVVFDRVNNNAYYYIDGTQVNTSTTLGRNINTNANFYIGKKWDLTNGKFEGEITQGCIFDYALSTSQRDTLYDGGTAVGNPMSLNPKPVAYYQLGDQSAYNGANYLVPNNSLQDYVFQTSPSGAKHISIPSITITSAATISIWVNIILFTGGTQQVIFGDQNTTKLVVNDQSGFVRVIYSDNSGFGILVTDLVTSDFTNKWHHIALVQNSGVGAVYIDNVNKGNTSGVLRTPSFAAIGALSNGGIPINGFVSNAAIFSTNLPATGTESIASLYNNGSPALDISSYSGLQRWYKLNAQDTFDGTNWTIKDYANNQDGTSVNMTSANLVQSNLQHTSGYSPYALDFGGISSNLKTYTIPAATNTVTLSAWVKRTGTAGSYAGVFGVRNSGGSPAFGLCWQLCFFANDNKIQFRTSPGVGYNYILTTVTQNDVMPDNTWTHVVGVADGTNIKIYINGVLQTDIKTQTDGTLQTPTSNILFAAQGSVGSSPFNGQLSNCARWNIGLTQAQVTEIYNQGVPSNLNNFSGTTPIGWWQLGSNSSFEGDDWTCLDEIGTDYADSNSTTMSNDDIVNGVGYSNNGVSSGMSDNVVGDAPYSTANGLSENMDVLDRVIDVPAIQLLTVDFLVIAGGAGGGPDLSGGWGGGGGAGGYRNSYNNETSGGNSASETALSVPASTNVIVTVGEGGNGATNPGNAGEDSVFYTITSIGGGGGGSNGPAQNGGSGGGSGTSGVGAPSRGLATANQGFDGGGNDGNYTGGGGGAGQVGGVNPPNGQGSAAMKGGNGLSSSITGTAVTRAGGGGGIFNSGGPGPGGAGGGGNGGTPGTDGVTNTGSAGGAGGPGGAAGGDGGSGIVILRYPSSNTITVGAGLTASTSTIGVDKVTIFTAGTGSISIA
jgi:hypothetical protein